MPTTAVRIKNLRGEEKRLKFMTVQNGTQLDIDIYVCDDNFIPIGDPHMSALEVDEEFYHRNLRKDSIAHGDLVKEECTNPEWHPDFISDIENAI